MISAADLAGLSDDELVDVLGAVRRQISGLQAVELAGVAALARRREAEAETSGAVGTQVGEYMSDEVGLALTVSGAAAARLIGLADDLTGRFTATWEALRKGRIDVAGAHAITEGLQHVEDEELARAVESAVLAETPGRTSSRLRRRVRDLLIKIDPEAAARRRTTAEKGRRVELYDNPSGTCDLVGRDLPADRAHGIFNKLRAAAKALKDDGDPRPIDAIRADLLLALCAGLPWPQAAHQIARDPNTGGDDVHVADVGKSGDMETGHVPAPMAAAEHADVLGLLERQIGAMLAAAIDAQLRRVRNIARQTARTNELPRLSGDALRVMTASLAPLTTGWCVATGNATNQSHGTGHYRPPHSMRRVLQRRHPVCCFPNCNRRAENCDQDHTTPYHQGGSTCPCNLSNLCRHHHRLKQHHKWLLLQPWPGVLVWITPVGRWHIVMAQ